MLVSDLNKVIYNAKVIFKRIKEKHPTIQAHLVLSTRNNIAPIETDIRTLLDICDDFFVESESLTSAWTLLDEIWELNESLSDFRRQRKDLLVKTTESKILELTLSYQKLLASIEMHDSVCVDLRWDDIDYDINRLLRCDASLVDISRTPQIGGIRICLGNLSTLFHRLL